MKVLLALALLVSGFSAQAGELLVQSQAKALVKITVFDFLNPGTPNVILKDDGKVYHQDADGEKVVAEVNDKKLVKNVVAGIGFISANAHVRAITAEEKADNEMCTIDSFSIVTVYGDQFADGSLVVQSFVGCTEVRLEDAFDAIWGDQITDLIYKISANVNQP